jgi:L-fuculose-phosphate aldolase
VRPAARDEDDLRFRIAAARRMLYREGCDSNIGGHVSARVANEDAFWATGFEYFDQTTPERIAKLDFSLRVVSGELAFSPALNFHARIYELRPDVNAIVHLHSHYLSVLSSREGRTIGMYNVGSVLFHDDQATYADDGHKAHVSVADALGDKRLVIIKNHGGIVASQSLESATVEALMAEQAARYHLECEASGGTEIARDEVVAGREMYFKHFIPNMWEANFERLRRSDPDLFAT